MNYYNPYLFSPAMTSMVSRPRGLLGLLAGRNITFGSILSGTQKALGVVNQAIPIVKQVTPAFKNAKTMFKVMNEFKKTDTSNTIKKVDNSNSESTSNTNGPTFFV